MTEQELRRSLCAAALAWLGLREADGGHRPILAAYNAIRPLPRGYAMRDTDPWCAAFVSAAAAVCGLTDIVFPECSCPLMARRYREAGRWEEVDFAVPRPGDVIFYDWDGDRVADHVGLVVDTEADWLSVVEGNRSDAVGKRRVHRDSPYILGYGQPDFAARAEAAAPAPERPRPAAAEAPAPAPAGPVSLRLPVLGPGSRGEAVRAAQLLLIGRGCRCGGYGADGDFGPATRQAVYNFQAQAGTLSVDGIIGRNTWSALLGL